MTAPARSREVLADLAAEEADALRFAIRHPEQPGAWLRACGLIHRDPQLAATTLLALAAMVPREVDTDELLTRIDELHAPSPRRG